MLGQGGNLVEARWGCRIHIWKACLLFVFGVLGGIFSAMSGSGIDICSFALLCLLFRVNERVSTPTSVVLMAINTVAAFTYRELKMQAITGKAIICGSCVYPS